MNRPGWLGKIDFSREAWAEMLTESDNVEPIYRNNALDEKQRLSFDRAVESLKRFGLESGGSKDAYLLSFYKAWQ